MQCDETCCVKTLKHSYLRLVIHEMKSYFFYNDVNYFSGVEFSSHLRKKDVVPRGKVEFILL